MRTCGGRGDGASRGMSKKGVKEEGDEEEGYGRLDDFESQESDGERSLRRARHAEGANEGLFVRKSHIAGGLEGNRRFLNLLC